MTKKLTKKEKNQTNMIIIQYTLNSAKNDALELSDLLYGSLNNNKKEQAREMVESILDRLRVVQFLNDYNLNNKK